MNFTRRQLLAVAPAALVFPRPTLAAPRIGERKFLFVYCFGGWDITMAFTPMFGVTGVDTEDDATTAEAKGITFVDHAERPAVRSFFESWGDRCCLVNGMEVRSVTHERCQRIALTGGAEAAEDWAVRLAANGSGTYAAPHLVVSGPAFSATNLSKVVRSGESGQLVDLADGSALLAAQGASQIPSAESEALEEAFLRRRIETFTARSSATAQRMGSLYGEAQTNLDTLRAAMDGLALGSLPAGCRRDTAADGAVALTAFQSGLSRCAMVKDEGWCGMSWDTHSNNNQMQTRNYEELFAYLDTLMLDLETRTALGGGPLKDEVTIVLMSEMGRHPQLQGLGRGHWTATSFMLIGSGVRGGQVIGEMDENFMGEPVDLESGDVSATGTSLVPGHLGATLLTLGGLDPADHVPGYAPLMGAIDL